MLCVASLVAPLMAPMMIFFFKWVCLDMWGFGLVWFELMV